MLVQKQPKILTYDSIRRCEDTAPSFLRIFESNFSGKTPWQRVSAHVRLWQQMKSGVAVALGLCMLLVGCSHERSPYTSAERTNNPPTASAVFTNPTVVPTSDRTNSRVYPGDSEGQSNRTQSASGQKN
jgi:hypothetical protein